MAQRETLQAGNNTVEAEGDFADGYFQWQPLLLRHQPPVTTSLYRPRHLRLDDAKPA